MIRKDDRVILDSVHWFISQPFSKEGWPFIELCVSNPTKSMENPQRQTRFFLGFKKPKDIAKLISSLRAVQQAAALRKMNKSKKRREAQ